MIIENIIIKASIFLILLFKLCLIMFFRDNLFWFLATFKIPI
jgi:hypothetical protein